MKEYMKPSIEMLEVELEQMIAESIGFENKDAEVEGGFYKESRQDFFFNEN